MELARIVHDPVRRKAMFSDISKTTPLTHDIWQQLLLHLGRANYKSVTRGGSRPLASPTAQQTVKTPDPRAIPIRQAEIFRPVIKKASSYGLSLLDGPTQAVPPEPVLKLSQRAMHIEGVAIERAKQLQHQVVGRIEATPTGHTVLDETQGWIDASHAWAGMEWARRNVQRALPDPDATRLIVESGRTFDPGRTCTHSRMGL